jgi:hypothetical protein
MTIAAIGLTGCGQGGQATQSTPARQKVVIKAHANLQDVVDKGEVLSGSSLGGAPFCRGGKFTGGHSNTLILRTFFCGGGRLELGFTPAKGSGRTVTGRWRVLSGTGQFKGLKGSGRITTKFAPGSEPAEALETFTGSLVR